MKYIEVYVQKVLHYCILKSISLPGTRTGCWQVWLVSTVFFYLQVNPFRTPQVVGALIDAGCPEDQVHFI